MVAPCDTPVYIPAGTLCTTGTVANPQLSEGLTIATKLGINTSQLLFPVVFNTKGGVGQVNVGG